MTKKTVVLCDDASDICRAFVQWMQYRSDVEIVCQTNGTDLLRFLEKNDPSPDLIILDVMLPDEEGDDITAYLRKHELAGEVPILLISGIVVNLDIRSRHVGAQDFLRKPFTPQELERKMDALLNARFSL